MQKTVLPCTISGNLISVKEMPRHIEDWLIIGSISQHSPRTTEARKEALSKFVWFLNKNEFSECGVPELRRFFAYLNNGHLNAEGRWGNPRQTKPLRPVTIQTFHKHLRTLFNWLVREEVSAISPMEKIPAIVARPDQVQPFTDDQLSQLLKSAKKSRHCRRDEAIVHFLLDTGLRASEFCGLRMQDVDLTERRCRVLGKGNKFRSVHFGKNAGKALWQYIREEARDESAPLFLADRGTRAGEALTRRGLYQLIQRLGKRANLQVARCSPHTFRHTFAVQFLRAGGNTFTLKEMLGHTSLHMTNRYVSLAQADIQNQHRMFSPGDRLKRG